MLLGECHDQSPRAQLPADRETSPPFATTRLDDVAAIFGAHSGPEARNSLALAGGAAEGTLGHEFILIS